MEAGRKFRQAISNILVIGSLRITTSLQLYSLTVRILHTKCTFVPGNPNKYALGVSKTGLKEDLISLSEVKSDVFPTVVMLDRFFLWQCIRSIVPVRYLQDFITWSDLNPSCLIKYEQFAKQTLTFFKEKYGVSVFFESNWTYGLTRRWQPIIESLDIRHVCILKEGLPISTYYRNLENNQNSLESYRGSLIFFINRSYAQLHLNLGFVNEAQVCVSGMARFDELISIGKSRAEEPEMEAQDSAKRKSVVFFVPDPPPFGGEAELEAHLERRIQECVRDVILVAKETPDLDFIVKTKVTTSTTEFIDTLMSTWSNEIPHNLQHHAGGLAKETLGNALIAIGFQTTALLDALALRVPIATPRTFYSFEGSPESILDLSSLSNLFSDGNELKSLIEKFRTENQRREHFSVLDSQVDEMLIQTVGNCDASSRARILSRLDVLMQGVNSA